MPDYSDALTDTSELDHNIRNKARMEALPILRQTPSDLPDDHWWWQRPGPVAAPR